MAFNIDSNNKTGYNNGVWANFQGSELLIANTGNIAYQRLVTRLQQPYHKKIERGTLDPNVMKDLLCKSLAEEILLNWRNVIDGEGNDVDYSKEIALSALSANEDLRDFVIDFASNYDNFKEEAIEEAVKS